MAPAETFKSALPALNLPLIPQEGTSSENETSEIFMTADTENEVCFEEFRAEGLKAYSIKEPIYV